MDLFTAIAVLVVSTLISVALAPKQQAPQPAAFSEIDFPQVEEGTPQCVVFGDCWTGDWMVLAVGDYRTSPIYSEGGKK